MANRQFTQFFYTPHKMPVLLDCDVPIGATGAVGAIKGLGISSVTRLAVGTYKVRFQDNYSKLYSVDASMNSPVTGSNVAATALSAGTVYTITALGTTTTANWITAGVPAGITPAVGVTFLAAAASSGTGTAKANGPSGIAMIETLGDPNQTLAPIGAGLIGGYVIVQCLGATSSSVTTLVPTDPASGSQLNLSFYLSNSSVVQSGE